MVEDNPKGALQEFAQSHGWSLADDFGRPLHPHYQIIDRRDEAERIVILAKQH